MKHCIDSFVLVFKQKKVVFFAPDQPSLYRMVSDAWMDAVIFPLANFQTRKVYLSDLCLVSKNYLQLD